MSTAVTSTRSVAMATVLGILVAASFVALAGDLWELGLPASLAAGALALVTPLQLRDGRFFSPGGRQGRFLLVLAQLVIFTLAYTVATALARIMHEGSDFGIDTKASAWYKCFVYRHLPTTEALA